MNVCTRCEAALLCIAGVAKFFLMTPTRARVYYGFNTSHGILLEGDANAACPAIGKRLAKRRTGDREWEAGDYIAEPIDEPWGSYGSQEVP